MNQDQTPGGSAWWGLCGTPSGPVGRGGVPGAVGPRLLYLGLSGRRVRDATVTSAALAGLVTGLADLPGVPNAEGGCLGQGPEGRRTIAGGQRPPVWGANGIGPAGVARHAVDSITSSCRVGPRRSLANV